MEAANAKNAYSTFNSIKVRLKQKENITFNIYYYFQFHKGAIETRCFRKCKLLIYNEVLCEQSYDFIIKKCRWLIIYFFAFCDNRHNNWGYNKSKTSFYSKRFVIKALKKQIDNLYYKKLSVAIFSLPSICLFIL